ncbi:hypothetical protein [Paraburkholderia sp. J41]|uniref:hypothetical protein n=1 Tax=Paraburkholderia sp. J41 TaxID=2805433 RepID=UPI002AC31532|nr:hypothetical protein [Paraburkholderia sp. J41]
MRLNLRGSSVCAARVRRNGFFQQVAIAGNQRVVFARVSIGDSRSQGSNMTPPQS